MKTPWIKSCDSNSERPFDSAQGPAQQPATLNPADADLQSASNQLYQHIPFDFAQGPAQGSVHQTSAMEAEALLALHQLEVLQLELKAQNEELQQLRELAELESAKYLELFHSSPTGYFTLSRDGSILDINMTGANILGKDQAKLKNNRFGFFVSVDSLAIFNYFFRRIFISLEKETCEVTLMIHGKFPFVVSLSGIAKTKGEHCFVTIINLSELDNASKLSVANQELFFQNDEKAKHAAELITINKELLFQNDEKAKRAAELIIANKELLYQKDEKAKRAAELVLANIELIYQKDEKAKRAAELIIANKELLFQNDEKIKRIAELIFAKKEILFLKGENAKIEVELDLAKKELLYQKDEKINQTIEILIENIDLYLQKR